MKTSLQFFSLEALQEFARDNKIFNDHYIRPCDEREHGRLSVLEVAGYSEIVPYYEVRPMNDERYSDTWYIERSYWVLRIITTGEIFRPWEKTRGKFRLFMHEPLRTNRDSGFRFELEEPNYIGKATDKKLSAWIDYLHQERAARVNYVDEALRSNRCFADKFRAKFPNGTFRTDSEGWTSEFMFDWERFRVRYTAHEDGNFSRHFDLRYNALPTDGEILG